MEVETRVIKLTQSAIDSAVLKRQEGGMWYQISTTCPIFQALKEAGFAMESCGLVDAFTRKGEKILLDERARAVTHTSSGNWSNLHPTEFAIFLTRN